MNHLAHALLAGTDPQRQLGGFLGDFVRGRIERLELPASVRDGVALHRAIDRFTDAHAEVAAARARFAPPLRRYAGIVLDMAFDHWLARDFACWSARPLAAFARQWRAGLHANETWLPPSARRLLAYMDEHDLPAGYADGDILARALTDLGRRLAHANPLDRAWPAVQADEAALRGHLRRFFPALQRHVAAWRPDAAAVAGAHG